MGKANPEKSSDLRIKSSIQVKGIRINRHGTYHVGVVCKNAAEPRLPNDTGAELLKAIYASEVQYGNHTGQVACSVAFNAELIHELLNSFDCIMNQRYAGDARSIHKRWVVMRICHTYSCR